MNFIVVVDQNNGIGRGNQLLVHLPADLKYFKEKTLNKVVVMGRKTLESLPGGKPLKDRTNIVLSTQTDYQPEGVIVLHSLEELFDYLKQYDTDEVFIAGGANIYKQLMPYCHYGYITKIHKTFEADQFLDSSYEREPWELIWESETQEHNSISFNWTIYENKNFDK